MRCGRCEADNPEVARFCWRCGEPNGPRAGTGRSDVYAVQPAENVMQLAVISSLLPHANRRVANEYRAALVVGGAAALLLTVVGLLAPAMVIGAFLLPVIYVVFAHDVDLWEERPGTTLIALYLLTAVGAAVVSLVLFRWVGDDAFSGMLFAAADPDRGRLAALPVGSLLMFAVALPVVSELVRQLGPVFLARQPRFDDMIDGFTFGAASGTVYAAFETVIAFGVLFTVGVRNTDAVTTWSLVIVNLMLVKPLVYGCASGLAVAAFSGRGEGYDGFTFRYGLHLLLAMAVNVSYWLVVRMLAPAPFGAALGLLWGALLAAALLLRTRVVLQAAILEAAVDDAAASQRPKWATTDTGHCAECETTLLPDSLFCIVCGASTRAVAVAARRDARSEAAAPDSAGAP